MTFRVRVFLIPATVIALSSIAAVTGCSADSDAGPGDSETRSATPVKDAPLEEVRGELLDLAFKCVENMPARPHVKTRARVREAVVKACLDLKQFKRSEEFIRQITNWRRGAAYAELAYRCVASGTEADVQRYLRYAEGECERLAADANSQAWRRDRIRVYIGKTYMLLGKHEKATDVEQGVVESEAGHSLAVKVRLLDPADVEAQFKVVEETVAKGEFDSVKNALEMCVHLFGRFYDVEATRARAEKLVRAGHGKLPQQVRIGMLGDLADLAIGKGASDHALSLVDAAQAVLKSVRFRHKDRMPMLSRLAVLRHRAGRTEEAWRQVSSALAEYDADRQLIVNIYRSGTLRPLAEACVAMGRLEDAGRVYAKAVEEGMVNPNSKPRAQDLSAVCCSMAISGFRPSPKLLARMKEIQAGLRSPW